MNLMVHVLCTYKMAITIDDIWMASFDACQAAMESASKEAEKHEGRNKLPAFAVAAVIGLGMYTVTRPKVKTKLNSIRQRLADKIAPTFVETPPIQVKAKEVIQ